MYLIDRDSKGTVTIFRDEYVTYEVEERDEDICIECPECGGSGDVWGYNYTAEGDHRIECPLCSGTGEYDITIYIDYEEVEENLSVEAEVAPYQDDHISYSGCSCTDRLSDRQVEALSELMSKQLDIKLKEKEEEKQKEKNKILEKIKSLDFSKLENMEVEELEKIAELMK